MAFAVFFGLLAVAGALLVGLFAIAEAVNHRELWK